MTRSFLISWLTTAACLAAGPAPDLLRFRNGDQLHGTFLGIAAGPELVWQRDDVRGPVRFQINTLRHIVLRDGGPLMEHRSLSHVELVGGDRIPGTVTAIDATTVTIDTPHSGSLEIPRGKVAMIAPNPLGGRVHYYGPFSAAGWDMRHPAHPAGLPQAGGEADGESPDHPTPDRWRHSGSAWYWQGEHAGTALIRRGCMTDRCVARFEVAWKKHLNLAIGLHADFAPVIDEGGRDRRFIPNDSDNLPRIFGNSYVVQLHSNYVIIYRTAVDPEGKPSVERVQTSNSRLRLGENAKSTIEFRSNRTIGNISMFVDGEFVTQWSDQIVKNEVEEEPLPAPSGNGIGFVSQLNECSLRISEIICSEWNGMPDSAVSLQTDDHDIVLMTNGLDRIAGTTQGIHPDGLLLFESRHGTLELPLTDISELRFARNRLEQAPEPTEPRMTVHFKPIGHLTGTPVTATREVIGLRHPLLGELQLDSGAAVMLELTSETRFFNDWDDNF